MFDQIISQGKELLSGKLKETIGLDDSQVNKSFEVAGESAIDGLKEEVTGGNLSGVMDLFNGKSDTSTSNPIVGGIANKFIGNLVSKLGISEGIASKVSDMIIPFIMSKFGSKETGEAKEGSDLADLLGGGGIAGALGGLLGGSKDDKDGKDDGILGKLGGMFG
ncbi:hypothetical protein [Brumimicrobium mesophilum]|uniref:hypothetical protein n=1 Tax=Brumimicrobium mesophilum TaxID=392717 RepID=UPI000D143A0C|nr:hypothetical protein [Brumimicrobium mesophilum]